MGLLGVLQRISIRPMFWILFDIFSLYLFTSIFVTITAFAAIIWHFSDDYEVCSSVEKPKTLRSAVVSSLTCLSAYLLSHYPPFSLTD